MDNTILILQNQVLIMTMLLAMVQGEGKEKIKKQIRFTQARIKGLQ